MRTPASLVWHAAPVMLAMRLDCTGTSAAAAAVDCTRCAAIAGGAFAPSSQLERRQAVLQQRRQLLHRGGCPVGTAEAIGTVCGPLEALLLLRLPAVGTITGEP